MALEHELYGPPELHLGITISKHKGKPAIYIVKKITDPQKIKILTEIIMSNQDLPAKIIIKDKLKFVARLKEEKLI